jgi:hypothetical protein
MELWQKKYPKKFWLAKPMVLWRTCEEVLFDYSGLQARQSNIITEFRPMGMPWQRRTMLRTVAMNVSYLGSIVTTLTFIVNGHETELQPVQLVDKGGQQYYELWWNVYKVEPHRTGYFLLQPGSILCRYLKLKFLWLHYLIYCFIELETMIYCIHVCSLYTSTPSCYSAFHREWTYKKMPSLLHMLQSS